MFTLTRWNSPLYQEALRLRNDQLKASAGKAYLTAAPSEEEYDIHLIVKQGSNVVGTVLLHPISTTCVQLKQVAIAKRCQGSGLGKSLITYAEHVAKKLGFSIIFLTGRKQAWGFYEKLSYQTVSDAYNEGKLMMKVYKKVIALSLENTNVKELKTNGRQ